MKASATTRLLYVGIALVVLLGIVAIASRGHATPAADATGTVDRGVSQALFNVAFTLWMLGMVGMAIFIVYLHLLRRPQLPSGPMRYKRMLIGLAAVAMIGIVAVVGARLLPHKPKTNKQSASAAQPAKGKNKHGDRQQRATDPSFEWRLAAGIVALVLGAGVTALVRIHRRRGQILEDVRLERQLQQVLDETLDDLYAEGDPRRAVIAAYARMERALGAHGLPRRPSEAPLEYLERVLLELRVSEPAVRGLTNLFEHAKFSPHDVDVEMKDRAIAALVAVRNDLRAVGRSQDAPELPLHDVPRPVG